MSDKVVAYTGRIITLILLLLLSRTFYIQLIAGDYYKTLKTLQSHSYIDIGPKRFNIYDSLNNVVATSTPCESVYAVPLIIDEPEKVAGSLSNILGLNCKNLLERLSLKQKKFIWVKRKITAQEAQKIRELNFEGIGITPEHKRSYPYGGVLAHILGFVDIDEFGQEGVEASANDFLLETSKIPVLVDARRFVLESQNRSNSSQGDIYLTINLALQLIVKEEVDKAVSKFNANWGMCVAMNPRTGEILALYSTTSFDPENLAKSDPALRRNRVIMDTFEPGSVIKPLIVAAALESKTVTKNQIINCENGSFKVGSRLIHDHKPFGGLTVNDIIAYSSNVGSCKIGLMCGKEILYECLSRFGLGVKLGIDLPAEEEGILHPLDKWSSYTLSSVPIGHEVAVTALQLVSAFSAIANDGVLMKPFCIKKIISPSGDYLYYNLPRSIRRAVKKETAKEIKSMLVDVVEKGTATQAKLKGTKLAGKTGTTQKFDKALGSYSHSKYTSSFVCFAPADDPLICVAVVIDEPKGAYYGGTVCAPVASKIISRSISILR